MRHVVSRGDNSNFLKFVYSKVVESIPSENRSKDSAYVHIWLQYIWVIRQRNGDSDEIRNMFKHLKSFSIAPKVSQFYIHWADFERYIGHMDKAKSILSNGLKIMADDASKLEIAMEKLKEEMEIHYSSHWFMNGRYQIPRKYHHMEIPISPQDGDLVHQENIPENNDPLLNGTSNLGQSPTEDDLSKTMSISPNETEEGLFPIASVPKSFSDLCTSESTVTSLSGKTWQEIFHDEF